MVFAFDAKRLFNNFTGLGNYSRTLIKNLQKYYPEHEYHLFTPGITVNEETKYFLDTEKFTVHSSGKLFWRTIGMSSEINALAPDIFHGLSHELPLGLHPDIKKVVTFHDLIYEIYPRQFGFWDRNVYRLKYKRAAKTADKIVCISKSTQKDLIKIYDIPSEKTCIVYQSCQDVFQEESAENASIFLPESPYFLYVGSLIPRKNLKTIVESFVKLPDSLKKPFVIVGTGPKSYVEEVKNDISRLNVKSWFHFINRVDNHQLVYVYDQSYLLCYPSVYEGFGIPVIESLFRRKPVITSNLSSLPEAAGPGGILVNPGDSEEIKNAFVTLLQEKYYEKYAEDGYKYVKDYFSNKATAECLIKLYNQLISR